MLINFDNYASYVNLIEINMIDFDVVLDMGWSTPHRVVIDHKKKRIRFNPLEAKPFEFYGTSRSKTVQIISVLWAQYLLASGCLGNLVIVMDKKK